MTRRVILSICAAALCPLLVAPLAGMAQQQNGGAKITSHRKSIQSLTSNDYWMAFPQNYEDQPGKYIHIYISSTDSTTAYVDGLGTTTSYQIVPGHTTIVSVPLGWEMKSCNSAESKVVHVWSDDHPLFVEFNSHNPYTSDGTYVLPANGWGKTYIVAAYGALFEGFGSYVYDYPSEFVVLSNTDGTSVTIIPSTDLRGSDDSTVLHPKGSAFTVNLNAGEAIQFKCVLPSDGDNFDVTGTRVVASNPVGVIGASQCANIPNDYPYCDFVCEMVQPERTWGTTYYTAPFAGKCGQTYLVIGTVKNQVIHRADADGTYTHCTLSSPYDSYWRPDITNASKWYSDQPFLLMQYSNSATYPDNVNGAGDPFMMAVNAVDNFSTPVIFNIFDGPTVANPYVWYAHIVAASGTTVTLDSSSSGLTKIYDDATYAIYRASSLKPGQHIVESASGVSVSVYGFGYDESVGYAAAIGVSTVNSLDTLAPIIKPTNPNPYTLSIAAEDNSSNASGLGHIQIDALKNVRIERKGLAEGSASATGGFDLVMIDKTQPAHASLRVVDMAGNYTTIEKDFAPTDGTTAAVETHNTPVANEPNTASEELTLWLASGSGVATILTPAPNPASNDVQFNYALRQPGMVTLDIFDVLGNRELSVMSSNEEGGVHSVSSDVRLLPSGAYIYRFVAAGAVQSGRLIIAR